MANGVDDWVTDWGKLAPVYSDGSGEVKEGDPIRYHQAPGGLMPSGDWRYGVAARAPHRPPFNEICLLEAGRYYQLFGHVIERTVNGVHRPGGDRQPG